MHTKNIRIFPVGLLGAWLWLVPVAPLAFTACDSEPVKVSVKMDQDYSQIIEAIQNASQTLTDKMSLIEAALSKGFADNNEARELLRQAVESLSGTAAEKLAAIETAIKDQTASLEIKLHGLDNHIPLGRPGDIISSGLILFINIFVGTEVACTMYAFYALFRKGGL